MPMSLFLALRCAEIFLAYIFITVFLPALAFGNQFQKISFNERLVFYFTIGNFFIINLVLMLSLVKISNRFTLSLSTFLFYLFCYCRSRNISVKEKVMGWWYQFDCLLVGKLGLKTAAFRAFEWLNKRRKLAFRKFGSLLFHHLLEWILLLVFTIAFLVIYGTALMKTYGYPASDMPVHNYWINYLGRDQVFVAGIYPFGFHCIIYYIHEIFIIDTYVILRVFALIQAYLVNLVLYSLLKYCCHTKYAPFIGLYSYSIFQILAKHTYMRFFSALPQEFGMLFIYPCAIFAFAFFKEKKREYQLETERFGKPKERRKKEKEEKKCYHFRLKECFSTWYLAGFAMSFSMTLAVHFYGTMIAGFLCVGIAVGYFFRFLRPAYFRHVVITCVISVIIAVLPMVIAFCQGTPLQGSLGWGMSILTGGKSSEAQNNTNSANNNNASPGTAGSADSDSSGSSGNTAAQNQQGMSGNEANVGDQSGSENTSSPNEMKDTANSQVAEDLVEGSNSSQENTTTDIPESRPKEPFFVRIKAKVLELYDALLLQTKNYLLPGCTIDQIHQFYCITAGLIGIGLLMFILRVTEYGAMIISVSVFIMCMSLLLIAKKAGLPTLMDAARCSIYFAYGIPLVVTFAIDSILFILFGWLHWKYVKWIRHAASLMIFLAIVNLFYDSELIRQPTVVHAFQSNEAVTCLTNIIHEEKDFTWTIVSANDELRMGEDRGWHYETIDFLRRMEGSGGNAMLTIPTESVYIFIEKRPIDYGNTYEGSGQMISRELAEKELPHSGGISIYQKENRAIVMSRMYYWAQEFSRLYPNEMKVYLETEDFICYKIIQNTYHLYNFAIDYGYNTWRNELTQSEKNDESDKGTDKSDEKNRTTDNENAAPSDISNTKKTNQTTLQNDSKNRR